MKKILSISLIVILIFSAFSLGLTALAAEKEYIVTNAKGAELYKDKQSFSQKIGLIPKCTILKALEQTDEFVKVFYEGSFGWALHKDLSEYEARDPNITKISIEQEPFKKDYYENDRYWSESFDSEGLLVRAHYKDGSVKNVKDFVTFAPVMTEYNNKAEVVVLHKGHYASFNINIQKHPISRIEIEKMPDSLSFKEGSEIDLSGIIVNAHYTDPKWNKRSLEPSDLQVAGYDKDKPGEQTIKLIYKYPEINISLKINIEEKILENIEITQKPNILDYYGENRVLNLMGIKILAHYDNDTSKSISPTDCKYIWKDKNPKYDEEAEIIVSYTENSVLDPEKSITKMSSFKIMLHELRVIALRAEGPARKNYLKGESFDMQGFELFLDYNNGDKQLISKDYSFKKPDMNIVGTHIIKVTYKTYETSFFIDVWSTNLYGDVDLNQKLSASDARKVLRYAAKLETFNDEQKKIASLGKNTIVTASNARTVLRMAAKLEKQIYIF